VGRARVARAVNAESNLSELSASALVERLRAGDLSAESYAQQVLKQCEAKKALNTMISLDPAQVLEGARQADLLRRSGKPLGRLHGLLLPVKDSINTHRLPTTSGTGALRDFHPNEDAPIIRQLAAQGAAVLGKTNLMEMSLGWTSNNKILRLDADSRRQQRRVGRGGRGAHCAPGHRRRHARIDTRARRAVRRVRLAPDGGPLSERRSDADHAPLGRARTDGAPGRGSDSLRRRVAGA
jgi:hypothetical protein